MTRRKADPMRVAQALMGSLVEVPRAEVGWTCASRTELAGGMARAWPCLRLCPESIRQGCEKNQDCRDKAWNKSSADYFRKCRKLEYRQVRSVMEV